ncbi:cypher isoform b [Holotrichia oblita]|uniref:Cypher isoform b n=1 Tax=Holotrichia oblita TaxID=644536 RepID=A0ACB9SZ58_HOLOL|nr:cypher isoform b [Holotrichia oblita]
MSSYQHLFFLIAILVASVSSQSNYANQANNIEYIGDGLPEQATLDGKVTQLDDLSPVIFLNRTKAALNCASGSMQVELKFNDNFYGIAYADFDRNSACKVAGKGALSYKLELPLKGCGTRQDPLRVFTNNIVVRFHPGLEMDGDEIITIVCRYPPPIAPSPDPLPGLPQILPTAAPSGPPLGGFQILLIICGILFLSLLLLGLGCSHYCLRRRNMTVIRHPQFSSIGTESDITKMSSSLGNLSMFEGVKIPRAHAPVTATGSSSGSDGPLISDTLPSDYPSESPSEPEDERSIPSAGSYENAGYIPDGSYYSEGYGDVHEEHVQREVPRTAAALTAMKEQPKFDVQIRVKKPPPSPPSLTISDTESSASRLDRNLSTIVEQREESVRSVESPPPMERTQFTYIPELHPPPKHVQVPPTYNKILRRQQEYHEEIPVRVAPARSIASLNTEMTDTHSMTEVIDDSHHKFVAPTPPPPPPIIPKQQYVVDMEQPESLEPPIAVVHKPEITSHVVDDVFLRTITEKRTIEDIERHKRLVTEYHTKPKPVDDIKWDVTIKHYPVEMPQPPDWENFSDISSASGLTLTPKMERAQISLPPPNVIDDNKLPLNSPELVGSIGQYSSQHHHQIDRETFLSTYNIPLENPQVPNWNILIRVLQPTEHDDGLVIESAETFNAQLTHADRMKWRQIITTESTLRTLLTEAVVREDYERIRYDSRYEKLFEPPKWDVIIRILAPERPKRYRKKNDWDTRSRRSSLPTLYEYDSDGGSSIKTLTADPVVHSNVPLRVRKSSRSSYRSEADLRSMSEMIVDFGRPDHIDSQSEASSYYPRYYEEDQDSEYKGSHHPSLARSLSQPSLARSASEFTERWVAPSRYDTASEYTTPEGTPKSQRSTKIHPMHVAAVGGGHTSMWQSSTNRVSEGPRGTQVISEEYRAQASSSTSTFRQPRKNWFVDNDSEASFK